MAAPDGEGKIRITPDDLRDPKVDEAIARAAHAGQQAAQAPASQVKPSKAYPPAAPPSAAPPPAPAKPSKMASSTTLYTALAGGMGALMAWGVTELVLPASASDNPAVSSALIMAHTVLWFAIIGALTGGAVGCIEGVASRAPNQAIRGGSLGFFVGLFGCAFGGMLAEVAYSFLSARAGGGSASMATQIFSRTVGWAVAGVFLGLGQGLSMLSARKVLNGFLGGLGGGVLGGVLFDPIGLLFGGIGAGLVSRGVGLLILGVAVGALMGVVEEMLKDAWLRVEQGLLAGKQFVIYKNPTLIGSSPKSHIYLFKDPSVEPHHAAIHILANRYEIEDLRSAAGTFVNGLAISRGRLRDGDEIRIGQTIFRYSEKRKEGR
jgi:hypothetical protein